MGIYNSKPITDKDSCDEIFNEINCGSSSMQGWRTAQEDAHNAILDYDSDAAFFAVYDGHGGHEVAEYTGLHFPKHILNSESYKTGNFEKALLDGFLDFDVHLLEPEVLAILKKMAGNKKGEDPCETTESEDEEEISLLKKEANMPIDELLSSNYTDLCSAQRLTPTSEGEGSSLLVKDNCKSEKLPKCTDEEYMNTDDITQEAKSIKRNLESDSHSKEETESNCVKSDSKSDSTKLKSDITNDVSLSDPINGISEKIKPEMNGNSASPKNENIVNGATKDCTVVKEASEDRTTAGEDVSVNGDIKAINGKEQPELVVEGKAISLSKKPASPTYTGKGKSGGKGGKVKGASTITTVTSPSTPTSTEPTPSVTKSLDPLEEVLAEADLSSDDEDEQDETFAIDSGDGADDENDDEEEEEEEEDVEDEDDTSDDSLEEEEEEQMLSAEDAKVYNDFYGNMAFGPGFDSGCTACVALLYRDQLFVGNVGDSRCVVSRDGKAVDMSVDHKPEDDIETDRIKKAGGKVTEDGRVNGGLNLSRALGDHAYKQNSSLIPAEQMISPLPDIQVLELTQQDEFIIIACDGIWNSLSSQEAVDFVKELLVDNPQKLLSAICEEMFEHCLAPNLDGDGTGCDNMTCIIVSLKDKTFGSATNAKDKNATSTIVSQTSDKTESEKPSDVAEPVPKKSEPTADDRPEQNGDGADDSVSSSSSSKRPSSDTDDTRPQKRPKQSGL